MLISALVCVILAQEGNLLEGYTRYLESIKACDFAFRSKAYFTDFDDADPFYPSGMPYSTYNNFVKWRHDRAQVITSLSVKIISKRTGKIVESAGGGEEIIIGDNYHLSIRTDNQRNVKGILVALRKKTVDELSLDHYLAFVAGIVRYNGGVPLPALLATASQKRFKRDDKTAEVECVTDYGDVKLVVSPERNFAPLTIVVSKQAKAKIQADKILETFTYRRIPAVEMVITIQFNKYLLADGVWVPQELVISRRVLLGPERKVTETRTECELGEFKLARLDEPLTPVTYIPDNFPVTVEGAEMIDHVWRDGKVVKVVDQTVVADLTAQRFKRTNTALIALFILGGMAAGAGGAYLLARRWRRGAMGVAR